MRPRRLHVAVVLLCVGFVAGMCTHARAHPVASPRRRRRCADVIAARDCVPSAAVVVPNKPRPPREQAGSTSDVAITIEWDAPVYALLAGVGVVVARSWLLDGAQLKRASH